MNNCKCEIKNGTTKSGRQYWCLDFYIKEKLINRVFIKETEILYYKELLKQ